MSLLSVLVCSFFLILSKFYILAALCPGLLSFLIFKNSVDKLMIKHAAILTMICLSAIAVSSFSESYDILEILERKQQDYVGHVAAQKAGSQFEMMDLEPTLISFLKATPAALINSMLRPFIWAYKNPLSFLSSIENLFIILIAFLATFYRNKLNHNQKNGFYLSISFVIVLYLIIGWTIPVEGAIVRYKVPGLIFLIGSVFILLDQEKLGKKLPILNKIKLKNEE